MALIHCDTLYLNVSVYQCTYSILTCLPEALNRTLFADVAFGLVLCRLCSSHAVEDRQPNHRLGLQAHPLQEVRHLNGRFPWGLDKEDGGVVQEMVNNPNIDQLQGRYTM